jgi:hypothetical protein
MRIGGRLALVAVAALLLLNRWFGFQTHAAKWASGLPMGTASALSPEPSNLCGNGICDSSETMETCFADCPGVTTRPMCGEEPHSDPGGEAVAWGLSHRTVSAAECCDRCAAHAADPKNSRKPCNSWVFCYLPLCWSLDTGHQHSFGECWLKWQVDSSRPVYGQRGRYSEEFRRRHWRAHLVGGRNLSMPTHVPWTGGVMGSRFDQSVRWETGPEGMTSSRGDELVNWRAWEQPGDYEKRVAAKQRADPAAVADNNAASTARQRH